MTPENATMTTPSEDDVESNKAKYLWIPYTLICLIFIALLLASFLHYHYRKRGKCRHTSLSDMCEPDGCCWCFSDCYHWTVDRRKKIKRKSNKRIEVSTVEVRPVVSISMAHSAFAPREGRGGYKNYSGSPNLSHNYGRQHSAHSYREDRSPQGMDCDAFGQSYG